jgi:hypothetical protein
MGVIGASIYRTAVFFWISQNKKNKSTEQQYSKPVT